MKCAEAERKIYLYAELDSAEWAAVDAHLKDCLACRRLLADITTSQNLLRQKFTVDTAMHPDLTLRIMNALPPRHSSLIERLFQRPRVTVSKLAMAAISLLLLVSFVMEQQRDSAVPPITLQASLWKTRLDSHAFMEIIRRDTAKNETPGLMECLRACKSEARECAPCKKRFPNILTQL